MARRTRGRRDCPFDFDRAGVELKMFKISQNKNNLPASRVKTNRSFLFFTLSIRVKNTGGKG